MAIRGQPSNIDYASPTQFQLVINQLPEVEFFITNLTLPGINLGEAVIPTPMKQIPVMGDEITFENLSLQFLVNETFENYMEIHNWLIAIGFPQSHTQFSNWRSTNSVTPEASRGKETDIGETTLRTSAKGMFSDATITLLTNKNNPIANMIKNKNFTPANAILETTEKNEHIKESQPEHSLILFLEFWQIL